LGKEQCEEVSPPDMGIDHPVTSLARNITNLSSEVKPIFTKHLPATGNNGLMDNRHMHAKLDDRYQRFK